MPLQCNIDSKGKLARLIWGLMLLAGGVIVLLTWAWNSTGAWPWIVGAALIAGGAFAIFEARAGWCVVRALGFKTRM
jgi:uncharacterized membrane protein HdeD (DUF308 family)